jgi:hypothetical protein
MIKFSSKITVDNTKALLQDLKSLARKEVLVGVPEEEDPRDQKSPIGNAGLAYIHDNGSPAAGIPAREFMRPGIEKIKNKIEGLLKRAAKAYLDNDKATAEQVLNATGLLAQSSIQKVIRDGENFKPLKEATLKARLRRRKSLSKLPKEMQEEIMDSFHPLIDTGQLLKAITYVIKGFGKA